jgi:cell division ATPase FtsA
MTEIAEQVFDAPVRIGFPERDRFGGLVEDLQDPAWTVATGLALFALKTQIAETQSVESDESKSGKFSAWIRRIRENFSGIF